ncbi:MAG: DegT/DnrJ/EryC1/StrS family aminotransferase [Acidobacteriaceae bacterium]
MKSASAPIPTLDLSRQFATIRDEVLATVERVCVSQHYVLGEEVLRFEQDAAAALDAAHAVGCASGTDALWLALAAANIGPGDKVITTPFTFFASASSITRAGARPVFVDIEEDTFNLDPVRLEDAVNKADNSLKAVMPIHLYGQCADMTRINAICGAHKMTVIEDAAQAFGAQWKSRPAGSLGDAAAFSFYPTKNLSAYGDAGLCSTNSPDLAERMRMLRNHGSRERYHHDEIGWNSRLDSIQAAVLNVKLPHLSGWNNARREKACYYFKLFGDAGLIQSGQVKLPVTRKEAFHIYHQFVIRAERRNELRASLAANKIGSEIYYPVPLHLQKSLAFLGYKEGDFPVSEKAAQEVLAIPIYPELTKQEQERVVEAIAAFYAA